MQYPTELEWVPPAEPKLPGCCRAPGMSLKHAQCSRVGERYVSAQHHCPMFLAVREHAPGARLSCTAVMPYAELFRKHPDATQAAQTAAVGMAELGLSQANPVAFRWLHVERHCYLCTAPLAPELQWGDTGIQSAWSRLRSAGFVPHGLPHTAVDIHLVDTNCHGNNTAEFKQCCTWSKNTWSLANCARRTLTPPA